MNLKCIVIDDEPLALMQMQNYVARVPFLELVESFDNAVEARDFLGTDNSVDLIFVDINMPELSGIDFVRGLESAPMVVFTTAYSEYAVESFKLDAIDYLLKPFSFESFERAAKKAQSIAQLLALRDSTNSDSLPLGEQSAEKECISIRADHKTSLVRYSNIVYIESAGEYVRLHLADGGHLVTLFRLKNMESALPSERFVRVHRSFIVNLEHVTGYTKGRVFLTGDEYAPIGENYRDSFAAIVEKIG
ncbi:MAG: response regulator transcription factor [Rikenellaceae bacterium]|nr:response regulator transcription factor [Rikenellaceae bacterium]